MVMRRVSLIPLLCIVAVACTPQASRNFVDRDRNVFRGDLADQPIRALRQSIELRLDPAQQTFSGAVMVDLEVEEGVESFTFHGDQMDFEQHSLEGPGGTVAFELTPLDRGLVRATPDRTLEPGRYLMTLDYSRPFETTASGLYRMTAGEDAYLFTQFEPTDARRAFPCWDEPSFKIPYQVTLHVPEGLTALTNTPVDSRTTSDGWDIIEFAETPPLPSYLLAIAVGPFDRLPMDGLSVPGAIYAPRGQGSMGAIAAEITPPILAALEQWFERPYPFAKLDFVAVPEFWPGAMENPGLVTWADNLLLLDPERASNLQRRQLISVTAHELAHMWFGDLVTLAWWDDLWLNESLTTWMTDVIVQRVFPEYRVEIGSASDADRVMAADARPSTRAIRQEVVEASDIMEDLALPFQKGQRVLAMVERWIGEDAFRSGILDYIDRNAWGNAVGEDLWRALDATSGKQVSSVLAGFLEQPGLPLIRVETEPAGRLELHQQRFTTAGVDVEPRLWVVPVALKYRSADGVHVRTVVLDGPTASVELGNDVDWVFPDADSWGYYRWSVPEETMQRLAGDGRTHLTERERIGFLGNAYALLTAGTLGGGEYLALLAEFASDPEPEVMTTVVNSLGRVRNAFVSDDLRADYAAWLRGSLGPVLARVGMTSRPGEDPSFALLRPRLIRILGLDGWDPEVHEYCDRTVQSFMRDPASVDPGVIGVALQVAARDGDRDQFDAYRRGIEQSKDPQVRGAYLRALGSFDAAELQAEALQYTIDGPLRLQEQQAIMQSLPDSDGASRRRFAFLQQNYDTIASRMPPDFRGYLPYMAMSCSDEQLAEAQEFFSKPERAFPGTAAALAKVTEAVEACVALRAREGSSVAAYLGASD
jgi:alanyl aminopeptidase